MRKIAIGCVAFFLLAAGCGMSLEHFTPDLGVEEDAVLPGDDDGLDPAGEEAPDDPVDGAADDGGAPPDVDAVDDTAGEPDGRDVISDDIALVDPRPDDAGPVDLPRDEVGAEDPRPDEPPAEIVPDAVDMPSDKFDVLPDPDPVDVTPDRIEAIDRIEAVDRIETIDLPRDEVNAEAVERCTGGIDEDGDGRTDCMDEDCIAAATECAGTCFPQRAIACGESASGSTTAFGSTARITNSGCVPGYTWPGPEAAYRFQLAAEQAVTLHASGLSADLDLFLLDDSTGRCDAADCLDLSYYGGSYDEEIVRTLGPGVYFVYLDGFGGATSSFTLSLACRTPENCTNTIDDDGDGLADCRDPDCYGTPSCPETCTPAAYLSCGSTVNGDTRGTGATDRVTTYSCGGGSQTGNEYVYTFSRTYSGNVTFTIDYLSSNNLDLFILDGGSGQCTPTACLRGSWTNGPSDSVTLAVDGGHTYYVVVDGYGEASGTYRMRANCYY